MNPLRLVLLGDDPLFGPLCAHISAAWPRFTLRAIGQDSAGNPGWEELLSGEAADLVLVARGPAELREDQLRRLVQAGVPVLAVHPALLAPLIAYELDMICRENGCPLWHYYPGQVHPLVIELAACRRAGQLEGSTEATLGTVEHVAFERPLTARDPQTVLDQLARDIDLLLTVCGVQTSVSAWGAGQDDRAYAALGVQFTGPQGLIARWTVLPSDSNTTAKLTVVGSRGRAILSMPANEDAWRLDYAPIASSKLPVESITTVAGQEHADVLTELERELLARRAKQQAGEASAPRFASTVPTRWFQACQSIDLLDAVQRSIAKGRTIELHFEDYSSPATFKGRMSAFGCLILLLGTMTCFLGLLGDMLGGIYRVWTEDITPVTRVWPFVLLAALLAYLFVQVLPKLFPESPPQGARDEPPSE